MLEKKSEAERIIYEDSDNEIGFLLLPDLKWDGKVLDNLYLTAICCKKGIKSLRDLNSSHLPLLKNILENGAVSVMAKNVETTENLLYCYFILFRRPFKLNTEFPKIYSEFISTISPPITTYTFISLISSLKQPAPTAPRLTC